MNTPQYRRSDAENASVSVNQLNWTKQGTWPGAFLWFYAILESFSETWTARVLDPALSIPTYACIDTTRGAHDCYIGADCFLNIRKAIESEYRAKGPQYFMDYANLCETQFLAWLDFAASARSQSLGFAEASNLSLSKLFQEYFSHLRDNGAFMDSIIVLADVLGDVVGNSVDALLNEYGIDDASAYGLFLETHSESPLPTNISLARAALGEIASTVHSRQYLFDKFQKNSPKTIAEYLRTNDPDVLKLLNDYIERFGWMSIYSFTGAPYSLDEVIRHVQDQIDQPDAVNTYGPQVASQEPEIEVLRNSIRNITINPKIRNLLEATRKLTYVNTAKDDAHQLTWLKIAPLMQAISARLALTLEEITYLTANEISEALEHGDLDLSAIKERMESWVLIKTPSAILALQGSHQVSEFKRRLRGLERLDSSHLSGLPVFPGRVKGRARVVLNSTDCEKVKTGDILVASNTNPDFIPAMRRAAAFVTDTGNLICHAVIAAREFRKPCVISTQIATRVIRDGEWLEVDGSNGTITRVGTE